MAQAARAGRGLKERSPECSNTQGFGSNVKREKSDMTYISESQTSDQSIRAAARGVKYSRAETPYWRLPYMSTKDKGGQRCWDMPMSGGYCGGNVAGKNAAHMLLKAYRADDGPLGPLGQIAASMCAKMAEHGVLEGFNSVEWSERSYEQDSICGQFVGFFNCLDGWLKASAKNLGANLDAIPEAELVARLRNALMIDEDAYIRALEEAA